VILYNRGFRGMCKRFIRDIWRAEDDCDLDAAFSGVRFFYSYLYAFGQTEERIDRFINNLRKLGESK
jgi:hypothetical protein